VVESHALPLVSVEVTLEAGVDAEPLKKRGLAGFSAEMLDEGTKGKTALQLAIAEENLAAEIGASSHLDSIRVDLNALKEKLPESVALLAEVLREPGFRKADIERVRGLLVTNIAKKRGQPAMLAKDVLAKLLYGDKHPWGLPAGGSAKTLAAIKPADLVAFHKTWFVPNNAVITVAGDTTPDEIQALLEKSLAGWKPHKLPKLPKEAFPKPGPRSISLEDMPGGSQSQVWIGWRSIPATDPDAVALLVANNVIGGLFTSRLNMNLREDKAYSYGVKSRVEFTGDTGQIVAAGGIVAVHTADAVVEMEKELARFASGEVSDEELSRAKTALIRGLPARLETQGAVVSSLADLVLDGLPLDHYAKLPAQVATVQKADVARVVKRVVTPDVWPVVVVGPKKLSEDQLGKLGLGTVTVVEPQ
jgi:zinc protease